MAQSCSLCLLVCDCHPAVVSRTVSLPHPPTSCFPMLRQPSWLWVLHHVTAAVTVITGWQTVRGATYRASDESVGAEWEVIYQQVSSALDGCFYHPARPKQEATEEKGTVTLILFTDRRRLAVQYCAKVLSLFISCGLDHSLDMSCFFTLFGPCWSLSVDLLFTSLLTDVWNSMIKAQWTD